MVTFDEFVLWEEGESGETVERVRDNTAIWADNVIFTYDIVRNYGSWIIQDFGSMVSIYNDKHEWLGSHGGSFSALIPISFVPRFVTVMLPTSSGCIRDITAAGADGSYLRSDAGTPD